MIEGPAARGVAGAITAQGVNALGALTVQVLAARELGVTGFARFVVISSVLIAITALFTGWVGDSLTVLERTDPGVRAGLAASVLMWVAAAAGTGVVCGWLTGRSFGLSLITAALLVVWLFEEAGRRMFTANRRYWALAGNDVIYNVITLGAAASLAEAHALTLHRMVLCMTLGSTVAVVASVVMLPRAEWQPTRPTSDGFREVAAFGLWRSLNVGLRPTGLLVARLIVAAAFGEAALASVQLGWLVIAPAMVVLNGATMFLLPHLRARVVSATGLRVRDLRTPVLLLVAAGAAWGLVCAAFVHPLLSLLHVPAATRSEVGISLVLGWNAYLVALCVAMPAMTALVALRRARQVLLAQGVETVLGVGLVAAGCALASVWAVPYLLAVGVAAGAIVTYRLLAAAANTTPEPAIAHVGGSRSESGVT